MRQAGGLLVFVGVGACALACDIELSGAGYFADDGGHVEHGGGLPAQDAAATGSDGSIGVPDHGDAAPMDASSGIDATTTPDASAPDAAPCAAYCNGQCVSSCAGCSAGQALCASTRQCGKCDGCTDGNGVARPIACFSCDANRQNPVGTCEPNDRNAYCLNVQYGSGHHCGCANYDVSLCPGDNQICVDDGLGVPVCVTCGETGSDGFDCRTGKKCHANGAAVPACK